MPVYFFHINSPGSPLLDDDEGRDLRDLAAARREAVASLCDLAREAVKRGEPMIGVMIQITDETGKVLDTVCAPGKFH